LGPGLRPVGARPGPFQAHRSDQCFGRSDDVTAEEALRGFERFPAWMWRNAVVLDFVGWLREHNDDLGGDERAKAGFYGLDLYSLYRSIQEVISYLDRVDPAAAGRARERYACFDHASGGDGQAYGFAAAFGAGESCEEEMLEQLVDLQRNALEYARRDGLIAADEFFYAEQNAKVVQASAEYYRTMFSGRVSSWNLRDQHMAGTLDALAGHLSRQRGRPAKIVVWAHNSHVGDARATELGSQGELDVGQLVRERHPGSCRLLGFTTYTGMVTAASDWGGPAERKWVRPALPDSVEELFHDAGGKGFMLSFGHAPQAAQARRREGPGSAGTQPAGHAETGRRDPAGDSPRRIAPIRGTRRTGARRPAGPRLVPRASHIAARTGPAETVAGVAPPAVPMSGGI